ncbi:N-acyl homoserine lactonase family protein [Sinosporangium siamense]|uniref:Metallo-beta-lactamase domain-containing protein n=1 Tax=Sinosporangium siamense TaxID=1367973 RepID=A0A919RJE9_9ACTN|nr:N-acyl homoserine lactonase family protein [Sinosporangium siamense]GII94362.1 hypothetical protein Ssi02_45930 [Sinosporangium siamense]
MLKTLGKVALLVLAVLVAGAWLVVLRLKNVPLPLLVGYGLLLLGLVAGLLWPGRFTRARVLLFAGAPAALATLGIYFAVVFYISDTPVLIGLAAATALASAGAARLRAARRPAGAAKAGHSRRAVLLAGAGVALGAVSVVSAGQVERRRAALAEQGRGAREEALRAPGARRRVTDGAVRVFPIHTGDTIVTYGQFYGGLDGWEGGSGYLRTLLDKAEIAVPVYAYLIDHPRHGTMMVDSGVNWEQAHDHDGYYNHNAMVSRLLSQRDEYRMAPGQDLRVQVARLGYDIKDITTVFLTHVHDDHAGGLRHLPQAKVVMDRHDWDGGVLYPHSFDLVKDNLDFPRFDSGTYSSFAQSKDYFGDGSVMLLPTPGHSPGHLCVALRMDGGSALFIGDTLYTLPHLASGQVRQMTIGGEDTARQLDAARRIQAHLRAEPAAAPLFAHDNTPYQAGVVSSVLSSGLPGADGFQRMRRHMDTVLTPSYELRPGHAPSYIPAAAGAGAGRVEFR